ncbi:MAG: hypothetical protein NC123_18395 [Butyrivibrio sp.]|nr:hypothetical protein [Butyrivibrio sp.]
MWNKEDGKGSGDMAEKEEFFDEKILEYRRRARNEKYSTLETGMYINNELVQFERRLLFGDKISIMLPNSFVKLPSELAKVKYMSEQRPQIIMTSLDTTVNVGLSFMDVTIEADQLKVLMEQSKSVLKNMNPAIIFHESKVEEDIDLPLAWFEFKSYGMDKSVYNLMFIVMAYHKMLHGSFNCGYDYTLEWREAARQIVYSIQEVRKD